MFLNKTIDALKGSNLGGTNVVLENQTILKKYFKLRFQQEKDLRLFKAKQMVINAECLDLLAGTFVSPRRLNTAINAFKSFNMDSGLDETVDNIFELALVNLCDRYSFFYFENSDKARKYIEVQLESKRRLNQFRNKQKLELKKLRNEIVNEGFIPQMLNNAFSNIKLSISNFKTLADNDLDLFRSEAMQQYQNSLELLMTEIFLEEIENA